MTKNELIERWTEIIFDYLYKGGYADVSKADARTLAEKLWATTG